MFVFFHWIVISLPNRTTSREIPPRHILQDDWSETRIVDKKRMFHFTCFYMGDFVRILGHLMSSPEFLLYLKREQFRALGHLKSDFPMVSQVPVQEIDDQQEDQTEQVDQDQQDQTELEL